MTPTAIRKQVIAHALALGFARVGIAKAEPPKRMDAYTAWLAADYHGDMAYMAAPDHRAARADPERVARGARSIICVALAYDHSDPNPPDDGVLRGTIAKYARGHDYHQVLKKRLYQLADTLAKTIDATLYARPATDSAPILERDYAQTSGLGFVGKNTMLITPGLGSYTVLGELLTDIHIAPTTTDAMPHCGDCRACLDACPTNAFPAPFILDANRCISYLTIEKRGPIPMEFRHAIGTRVFGCDSCQDVCPYNARAPGRARSEPLLRADTLEASLPSLEPLTTLGSSRWRKLSRHRAIHRATKEGLIRNAAIALGNTHSLRALRPLAELLNHPSDIIREHAGWALVQIARSQPAPASASSWAIRDYCDDDLDAISKIHDLARILELDDCNQVEAFVPLQSETREWLSCDIQVAYSENGVKGESGIIGFVATRDQKIHGLYISRQGMANDLYHALAHQLLRAGIARTRSPTQIDILATNSHALALYTSAGFTPVKESNQPVRGHPRLHPQTIQLRLDHDE